jgi:hypothetical protein
MVTVIHTSDSLYPALNYNHQKEVQGKATCILAANYPKDPEEMNFYQKLHRLTNQAALRPRTQVNSVHISINFDPSEKLDRTTLEAIAQAYMEKIGFGEQPYLVYEHRDAGHPHLHVVTTNIRANGKRIELHNLGKNQSEKARKAVEKEFGLVRADQKKQQKEEGVKALAIKKVIYGQSETRRAITNVLDVVLAKYKFSSLEELNAVLRQANVQASRGSQDSRTYQRGGLLYQVLDENGKPVGVPIKASSIYSKPTLSELRKKFEANAADRPAYEKRVKMAIDWYFLKTKQPSMDGLKAALGKESITLTEYKAKNGQTFGVTYVDHKTGGVFKGSDIGKEYTAKGIEIRVNKETAQQSAQAVPEQGKSREEKVPQGKPHFPAHEHSSQTGSVSLALQSPGRSSDEPMDRPAGLPYELQQDNKKKRRKKRIKL